MNLPEFTAELALNKSTRTYRGTPRFGSFSQSAEPSMSVRPSQLETEGLDVADEAGLMGIEEGEDDVDVEGMDATGADEEDDAGYEDDSAGDDVEDAEAV